MDKFWMVKVRSEFTEEAWYNERNAICEAEILAKSNPGEKVYLLEAMQYCEVPKEPLTWKFL